MSRTSVNGKCVCDVHRTSSYTSGLLPCFVRVANYCARVPLSKKRYILKVEICVVFDICLFAYTLLILIIKRNRLSRNLWYLKIYFFLHKHKWSLFIHQCLFYADTFSPITLLTLGIAGKILSGIGYKFFHMLLLSLRTYYFSHFTSVSTSCIFHSYVRRRRKMQSWNSTMRRSVGKYVRGW